MKIQKIIGAIALSSMFLAGAAAAQTSTTSTSTPGLPNTGSGGHAGQNTVALLASAAVALAGAAYLARDRRLRA